ncbi:MULTISPECIES: hypothetical protein [Pseudomonas]|uniref:Uncharacterized protein n=1 Tax=Pseudomonas fluorescens LMG 5329 TaxID=1324332 RepID=A0A0A1Z7I8_PSEFL|nr:hypothetical protein [Pseudomonas fluorescens]KGE68991.1 hypothetical protein K814_0105315 [Pseudomonas fluorescens LMG 5329]NWD99674.1 hypothetical protein [Pseudomonas sp. IPO3749]NWF21381.1 hypothetical protein [Pseudomonas sp. IPO3749]
MSEVERYWIEPSRLIQEGWHQDDTCVVKDWAYDLVVAERDALQQRLTAADEQIDLLTPCHTEQPEGKRERFEKWVMATKHPVYGFLDGRSLARGDDRTGYADEYVQGLWVAYLAFGAEQPAPVAVETVIHGSKLDEYDSVLDALDPESVCPYLSNGEVSELVSAVRTFQVGQITRAAPVAVVLPERSAQDYAIEHAEYMAKSADDVMAKFQAYGLALLAVDEGGDDGESELLENIDSARGDLQESLVELRSMVYEFRKRAAKSR